MAMDRLTTFLLANFIVINAETVHRKDQRIVGGSPAPAGRFPFFAQFDPFVCGASLIHSDIVLGAAHCCAPEQCGLLFDSIDLGSGTPATVEQYVLHPQFDDYTLEGDVMIMKLTTPLNITPIGYNTQGAVPVENQNLTAIGFGYTSYLGDVSEDLLQVTVNYVPNGECGQAYQDQGWPVLDDMICAAAPGKDACSGDSGGPLLTADDGNGEIAGLVSWGYECADPNYPGVYTRVSTYQEWIEEAICCLSDDPPDSCTINACSAEFGSVSLCDESGGNFCFGGSFDDDWYWCFPGDPFCDNPIIESINSVLEPVVETTSGLCLSPVATAMVEKKGKVSMKDVSVGDKVMTASEKYQTVFTISHSHPNQLTSFLSVQTKIEENPLELTPLHMLFLQGKQDPIPAKDVKIGDEVQTLHHGPQKVTNVTVVTRHGFYNPVTMDGTIVVDGIIASTYTSLNGGSYLEIAGREWISFQLLFDIIASPFRAFCTTVSLGFCAQHQPSAVHSMVQFYEFWSKQNNAGQVLLFFAFVSFFGLARIMLSPAGILVIMVFIGVICHSLSTRISTLHKKKIQEKKN